MAPMVTWLPLYLLWYIVIMTLINSDLPTSDGGYTELSIYNVIVKLPDK